jgi:hypothetical protein
MPQWAELLIVGVVSIGAIVVGKAIINRLAVSRRPSHHLTSSSAQIASEAPLP